MNEWQLTEEQSLIEEIKAIVACSSFLGDDCAVLPGQALVSTDVLVERVHFRLETTSLEDLGWKAIAVNLSDIAAMAGRPRYLTCAVVWPAKLNRHALRSLYRGMEQCATAYRCKIVGGDITRGDALTISITVIGEVHENGRLLRSGAKAGDVVVATGDFGASAAGLSVLERLGRPASGEVPLLSDERSCVNWHVRPHPRLCESWAMVRRTAGRGALMDASDGLADALLQIGRASNVGMTIDVDRIPIAEHTRKVARAKGVEPLEWALYGGEDYELVGCIDAKVWHDWPNHKDYKPFTQIGTVTDTRRIELVAPGKPAQQLDGSKCFQHFAAH